MDELLEKCLALPEELTKEENEQLFENELAELQAHGSPPEFIEIRRAFRKMGAREVEPGTFLSISMKLDFIEMYLQNDKFLEFAKSVTSGVEIEMRNFGDFGCREKFNTLKQKLMERI